MRTTLNVDDDVLDVAKSMAHVRKMSVGDALSELARRGMSAPAALERDPVIGLLVFAGPVNGPPITTEDVKRMKDELDREDAERAMGPFR